VSLIVIALISPIILSFQALPLQRLEEVDSFTTETRLFLYFLAAQMFLQNPIIGVGTMNFQELLSDSGWQLTLANTHNLYLQVLSENGMVGFLLAAGPFLWLAHRFWRRRREPLALVGLASLACVATNGTVDFLFVHPQYLLALGLIMGSALGAEQIESLESTKG
jgi:O-antigen ligase